MGERQNGPLGLQLQLDTLGYKPGFRPFGQTLRLVLPGPLGTPDWHVAAAHNRSKEAKHVDPPAGETKLEKFKRQLLALQVKVREKDGKKAIDGLGDDELAPIPGAPQFKLRNDVAALFGVMWKEANDAFLESPDSKPGDSIGIASTYRSAERDAIAWQNAFPAYEKDTKDDRLATGDEYGKEALQIIFDFMNGKKAPPGFSGHTHGIAADLVTTESGHTWLVDSHRENQLGWQKTWLYKWLVENAGGHNFYQLKSETWHWEYHADGAPRQCWDGDLPVERRPVPKKK